MIKTMFNCFRGPKLPDRDVVKVEAPCPWPPPPPFRETQPSVYDWFMRMFPRGGTSYAFAVALVEEAIELGLAAGIHEDEISKLVVATLNKSKDQVKGPESDREEVGDVQMCLYAYAESRGYNTQDELDKKMVLNRSRPKSYYDANTEKKRRQGIVFDPPLAQP